jgi:hypothetical protein
LYLPKAKRSFQQNEDTLCTSHTAFRGQFIRFSNGNVQLYKAPAIQRQSGNI